MAAEVLHRTASLYAIEDDIRGLAADQRRRICDQCSRAIVDDLKRFLEARGWQVSAKSSLDDAICYTPTRWDGLTGFLDDGRKDLDDWAVIAALIENCKLTGINPHTCLTATLNSLANSHPISRIDEFLPHAHVG